LLREGEQALAERPRGRVVTAAVLDVPEAEERRIDSSRLSQALGKLPGPQVHRLHLGLAGAAGRVQRGPERRQHVELEAQALVDVRYPVERVPGAGQVLDRLRKRAAL
jgi:hypothetical protein